MLKIRLEQVFTNSYYKNILNVTDILDKDYDMIEELAEKENNYSAINTLLEENSTLFINYNLNTFFMNNIPENLSANYTFSSDSVENFLYCIVKELISNIKNIKFNVAKIVTIGLYILRTKNSNIVMTYILILKPVLKLQKKNVIEKTKEMIYICKNAGRDIKIHTNKSQ